MTVKQSNLGSSLRNAFKHITSKSVSKYLMSSHPFSQQSIFSAVHSLLMSSPTQGRMWLCTHITFKITLQQPCLSFYSKSLAHCTRGHGERMNMCPHIEENMQVEGLKVLLLESANSINNCIIKL